MRHRGGTACFVVFLIVCLLLHLTELALQVWAAVGLYTEGLHVWFALLLGLLIVPLLTAQLLSCQWAWPEDNTKKKGPGNTTTETSGAQVPVSRPRRGTSKCLVALPHLLCVAVPWRYTRLILTCGVVDTKKELSQICLLRVFLAFSSSLPVLLLETYLLLNNPQSELGKEQFILYCTLGVTLFSACWSLATHRKRSKDYQFLATLISWPGTVFRVTWRFGELTARLLVLALFAGLHSFWIFLVLALHWVTMIMWCLTEQMTGKGTLTAPAVKRALISSYIHVFCYLNTSQSKARARLVLFYVLMSLENAVLLVLWFLYDPRTYLHVPMAVLIGACYVFAFVSAVLYYNCFHVKSARVVQRGAEVMYMQPCMNCWPQCCDDKRGSMSNGDTFHPAWWIEVKENTEVNPNNYDMLLPSELKRNGVGKRSLPLPKGKDNNSTEEVRYWGDVVGRHPDLPASAVYETLSQYQKQHGQGKGPQHLDKGAVNSQRGRENRGFTWDDYIIQQLPDNHLEGCLDPACRGRCLSRHPHQISDSGISATTTNTSSEDQSGSRYRSDGMSLLYTSDTSDFTSTRTSLSYLDPLRIHRLSLMHGEDDWSMTSSSYGRTSSESARDLSMYLPMLTHLNNMAEVEQLNEQLLLQQQQQQHHQQQLHRSPAPLPIEAATTVGAGVTPVVSVADPTPEVHYDHVPSNASHVGRERRMRIRMGRYANQKHRNAHRRRASNGSNLNRKLPNQQRRAVPCGVAGKLHSRRHSDASDIRSRSSFAASTTDSYDGSLSDWGDVLSDRMSSSLQLPGTQSDLDFSVCGEYPYTTTTETENEYVEPTSHPHLSQLRPNSHLNMSQLRANSQPNLRHIAQKSHQNLSQIGQESQPNLPQLESDFQSSLTQMPLTVISNQPKPPLPKIIQKLDESGNQIGFVC